VQALACYPVVKTRKKKEKVKARKFHHPKI
jgi:hypothetical protein